MSTNRRRTVVNTWTNPDDCEQQRHRRGDRHEAAGPRRVKRRRQQEHTGDQDAGGRFPRH